MSELLIVDDEAIVRRPLERLFAAEGYAVRSAKGGREALAAFAEKRPDLVLLDVMMPDLSGFKVCEQLRDGDRDIPIVFLTCRDGEADQVRAFGLGADDYVAKDAGSAVLLARVARALERAEAARTKVASAVSAGDTVTVGGTSFRLSDFTRTESEILRDLARHRGEILSGDRLIEDLRGENFVCEDSMIYVHISNLRKKLGKAAGEIECLRGHGYRLK